MGNRIEVSLSNRTFRDVTAWRAIRNAERNCKQGFQTSPSVFQPEKLQVTQLTTNKIAELNGQLSTLWQRKKTGEISPKEYRVRQQELAGKLYEAESQRGHKPIRTKAKFRMLRK